MTNFERYKGDLFELLLDSIGVINGEPVSCRHSECESCEFFYPTEMCTEQARKWLCKEVEG